MGTLRRHSWVLLVIASASFGCSDWAPIRSAANVEGQRVKVEADGKETVIEEVVTCDDSGFIIANEARDCHENRQLTFDTRRDKVFVYAKDNKASVGRLVACVLAGIFIPAAIVGSAILTAH